MPIKLEKLIEEHINLAKDYYEQNEEKFVRNLKLYNADSDYYSQIMPKTSLKTNFVSNDIKEVVEWIMPSLMRIFFGFDDVVKIVPRTEEDVKPAKLLQALIKYQIKTINDGFTEFYKWFKNSLITGGYIKLWWEKTYRWKEESVVVNESQLQQLKNDPDIKIKTINEKFPNIYEVVYLVKEIDKDQPKFEALRIDEVLISPDAKRIEDAVFVAHRKYITASELRIKEQMGLYKHVEKAIERSTASGVDIETQVENYIWQQSGYNRISFEDFGDKSVKFIPIYECYLKVDLDNDGIAEDWIITYCNGVIIRKERNHYGRAPIFYLAPILSGSGFYGDTLPDMLSDIQYLKTAMIRQLIINMSYTNEPKYLVDPAYVNTKDLSSNSMFIRVNTNSQSGVRGFIEPIRPNPIAPQSLAMIEMMNIERESRSGITRYNQGLDAKSLNKTATGISLIMQASNQRIELIARVYAETGVKDFFRFLVYLNQKFLSQEVSIRVLNERLVIRPDDLAGKFDFEINVGSVGADKQMKVEILEKLLIAQIPLLLKLGLTDPMRIRNAFKEMLETMGIKNVNDFLVSEQDLQQLIAMQQQQILGGNENVQPQQSAGELSEGSVQ